MVGKLLALLEGHLALTLQIALIADQNARNVVAGVLFNLSHPVLHRREGVAVSDIVGDDDAVGAFVVAGGDGLETFLTGRVPNLQLDGLSVYLIIANFEVDSNRRHEAVIEQIILIRYISISLNHEHLPRI